MLAHEQWALWDGMQSLDDFYNAAGATTAFALVLHAAWCVLNSRHGVLPPELYSQTEIPRLKDASNFVHGVVTLMFLVNWFLLILSPPPTLWSIGQQSGACAGLEIYGAVVEIAQTASGCFRPDMALHHLVCLAFVGLTGFFYSRVLEAELYAWHVVWDSISRMLVSNVLLSLRHFYRGARPV